MILDTFLDKLDNVRPAGGGYTSICPSHDDSQNSLSVTEGEDERILLKCHAGCTAEMIVHAMGLELKDLFARTTNFAEPDAIYVYTDEQGNELYQAVRLPGKQFRQRHYAPDSPDAKEGGWVWKLEGVRRVLYHLPEVIEGVRAGRTIYIVEGEKDVETLRSKGYVATCNPMGAGKWKEEYAAVFAGANVIIIQDRDAPGRAQAEAVKKSLLPYAKGIWIRESKRGKDVTDHVIAGYEIPDLVVPRVGPRRGIITASEMAESGRELLEVTEADSPGYVLIDGLPILARKGRMYTIGAYTGDGKTTLGLQITRRFCTDGARGGYFSLEMPEQDLRNKLVAHRGVPLSLTESPWRLKADQEALDLYLASLDELGAWDLDIIFDSAIKADKVEEYTRDREYDFVVIDHVHRFGWGSDRRILEEQVVRLTNIALEHNIPVFVLSQFRKFTRGQGMQAFPRPTVQDLRETSQLADDSSMTLGVWRQRDEQGTRYTGGQEIIILKNRHRTGPHDATGRSYFPNFDPKTELFSIGGQNGSNESLALSGADGEVQQRGDPATPGESGPGDNDGETEQAWWDGLDS